MYQIDKIVYELLQIRHIGTVEHFHLISVISKNKRTHTGTKKRGISTPLFIFYRTTSIAQTKAKLEGLVWCIEWNIFQLGLYVLHRGRNLKWELANRIELAKA